MILIKADEVALIDRLVEAGLLDPNQADDNAAVAVAVQRLLGHLLQGEILE